MMHYDTDPDHTDGISLHPAGLVNPVNCGDVSPTTLSPEVSPSNSCDEGEGASNIAERLRRRRSSVDLAMNIYPGDLLVQEHHKKLIKRNTIADFYAAGRQPNGVPLPPGAVPSGDSVDVTKKGRQPFSLLKLMKTKSKESLTKLDEILRRLKPSEFKDKDLAAYKLFENVEWLESLHWSDLIASTDKQHNSQVTSISDTERKRREAVWELFKSECVFLIDHLMVLKHCFMEPLKKVQVEGSLMFAEPQDLFGNLDELSYVSYTFCKDFIAALLKDMSITDFGRTNVLLKAFQRFSAHSRDGAVYHSYCLNYANALTYLEKLRANSEFSEFEKWCEQDPRCNRLQITDLLVAPMQHCTKLPLLLHNVRKYTADEDERQQVAESIEKMEASLKQLEEKMKWIKNFERVQEIQRQIVWPTVTELDPRCVIPESLKPGLSKQPCERLLICPKRQLLHEGQLTLVETPKPLDIHMFLFDDILLITKVKKIPRKSKQSNLDLQSLGTSDRTSYIVLRQPLALDRFTLHDISPSDAAVNGLKHCFVLVHISRFQQIIGAFTFQAACDATKSTWLIQIKDAMEAYAKAASSRNNSFKENRDPKSEEKEMAPKLRDRNEIHFQNSNAPRRFLNGQNSFKNIPTKSRSMDAVFI
ncbi:prolactin receptor [Bulinus truncatus]|nr:prolactin receptor [Bulinus truncatus]